MYSERLLANLDKSVMCTYRGITILMRFVGSLVVISILGCIFKFSLFVGRTIIPPLQSRGFAFVRFADKRDAEDAQKDLDGTGKMKVLSMM